MMIERILQQNPEVWEQRIDSYVARNQAIRITNENSTTTLHEFNQNLAHLHDEVAHFYYRARAFKDSLEKMTDRIIKSVDNAEAKNESGRRAIGIRQCQHFQYGTTITNLFDLTDRWVYIEYTLDALMKSIRFKADAKITNNSLLNLERSLVR